MEKKFKLYAVKTWGSAIVEYVLDCSDFKYEIDYLKSEDIRSESFKKINPVQQIPVLVLPDGEVITESLAIANYLNHRGQLGLVPEINSPEYARYWRWSMFLASSYAQASYVDHPDWYVTDKSAQNQLKENALKKYQERFLLVEQQCQGPYFLGEKQSLIDVFLAVMTFWTPGPEWYNEHCPKIMKVAARLHSTPAFQEIYKRNTP